MTAYDFHLDNVLFIHEILLNVVVFKKLIVQVDAPSRDLMLLLCW